MLEGTCHCGAVRFTIPAAPETVTDCNCSICRRLGVLWAYYSPTQVTLTGETDTYQWGDRALFFHRCKACGVTTHWSPTDPKLDRMAVNARLLPLEVLETLRIRRLERGADGSISRLACGNFPATCRVPGKPYLPRRIS